MRPAGPSPALGSSPRVSSLSGRSLPMRCVQCSRISARRAAMRERRWIVLFTAEPLRGFLDSSRTWNLGAVVVYPRCRSLRTTHCVYAQNLRSPVFPAGTGERPADAAAG